MIVKNSLSNQYENRNPLSAFPFDEKKNYYIYSSNLAQKIVTKCIKVPRFRIKIQLIGHNSNFFGFVQTWKRKTSREIKLSHAIFELLEFFLKIMVTDNVLIRISFLPRFEICEFLHKKKSSCKNLREQLESDGNVLTEKKSF